MIKSSRGCQEYGKEGRYRSKWGGRGLSFGEVRSSINLLDGGRPGGRVQHLATLREIEGGKTNGTNLNI